MGNNNSSCLALDQTRIGNYEILDLVGSGGLGQVFKAQHIYTGKIVALKRLHDSYQYDKKLLGLFHKEIMIHAQVSHKHCVIFITADLTMGNAHIVTNFVDGYNCYNLIRNIGALPPLIACSIVLDMLQGLEHLHCLDIIHSDLTPSNVILDKCGLTLLADFGLSCMQEIENYANMTVGTPGYQAPERLVHAPISTLSDIYGAGILLHEMLTGERLFNGLDDNELKNKMRKLSFSWINTGDNKIDKLLKMILSKALAYNPRSRFETPRDFMFALYQCLKLYKITHTRRAILQWLVEKSLTHFSPDPLVQKIYITKS